MNTSKLYRKNAIATGILFLLAIVAGVVGGIFLISLESAATDLTIFADKRTSILIGSLLTLIMGLSCAMIAVPLYPVLRKKSKAMAMSAVGFRFIETTAYIIGVVMFLAMLHVSTEYVNAGAPADEFYNLLNSTLYNIQTKISVIGSIFFNLGAFMYCFVFFKTKLIPRWISGFALFAVGIAMVGHILVYFGLLGEGFSSIALVFELPTLLYELTIAFWLIIKGFNQEVIKKLDSRTVENMN